MSSTCCINIRSFTAWIGFILFAEVFGMGYFRSVLTTIERRFALPSTTIALLSSSFQIGSTSVMIFVCYFGSRYHRPRTIAIGTMLIALGFFLAMVPQFIGDRYEFIDISLNTSTAHDGPTTCDLSASVSNQSLDCSDGGAKITSTSNLYGFIFVGILICGIGASPMQPLGISYIDDHANEQNTALYIGIVNSMGLIGPATSFVAGSFILKIWVDFGWVDTSTISISPKHPGWVGAWWLGFIFPAIFLLLISIPLWFFPAKMGQKLDKEKKENNESQEERKNIKGTLKLETRGLLSAFKRLFTNKRYLILVSLWTVEAFRASGLSVFAMKYIEAAFGISPSEGSFLIGTTCLPCLVLGVISGSLLIKRLKLNTRGIARLLLISIGGSMLLFTPMLFVSCTTTKIAGLTVPYPTGRLDFQPKNSCNSNCNCKDVYTPVCGPNNVTYLTPCHAGCTDFRSDQLGKINGYTSCLCVDEDSFGNSSVSLGRCEQINCDSTLSAAVALLAVASWFGGLHITPLTVLVIRTLTPEDKAFGMGVGFISFRLLAFIPGPVVFGYVIDQSCLFWSQKACSKRTLCRVYDNEQFRFSFFGLLISIQAIAMIIALVFYCKYACQDVNNENEKQDKTNSKAQQGDSNEDAASLLKSEEIGLMMKESAI